MGPLVVSFHTGEDRYVRDAERMVASAQKFGYETYVEVLESDLNWTRACCLKPSFMINTMERFGRRPYLWLDCDAEVLRPLDAFENPIFNFGVTWDPLLVFTSFFSGAVYFNLEDDTTLNFMMEWGSYCGDIIEGKRPEEWDQRVLFNVWRDIDRIPVTQILGRGYSKIFDRDWSSSDERIEYIRHHQASREIRKTK
jgi:hypothetical protein